MPFRKEQLVNKEFYHIVKRGVEERKIFLDDEDCFRFVNSLLVFNDKNPAPWKSRAFWHQRDPLSLSRDGNYKPENSLIKIHAFVLMPNHFHLLVQQLFENGIVTFMNKLGGYSYYFNKKYKRVGPLFQARYKIKLIETEVQLKNNFVYIHTNPISLIEPKWKEGEVKNPKQAVQFLEDKYRWSSYFDYQDKVNFPLLTDQKFFFKLFGNKKAIKEEIKSWILFKSSTRAGLVDFLE